MCRLFKGGTSKHNEKNFNLKNVSSLFTFRALTMWKLLP